MRLVTMRMAYCGLLLLCLAMVGVASAQETAQKTSADIKATTPVEQDAEWAKSWWMPRHEEKLAALKQVDQVDLLMIGDSITHGWETGGQKVWDEFYADRHAFNIGFSGDRTEHVLWRLQHGEVDGISPKLVVMMIGTNNTGHRQDPAEETAAGVEAILGELQKRLPNAKVLLLGIFPRGATADDRLRQLNDEINQRLEKLADHTRVHYLDINEKFLADDGTLPKSTMPDLLHPNEAGYRIWAEAMEPAIVKLMGETTSKE